MGQVRNGQYVGVHHGDVGRWRTHGGQEMEDTGGGGGGQVLLLMKVHLRQMLKGYLHICNFYTPSDKTRACLGVPIQLSNFVFLYIKVSKLHLLGICTFL